MPSLNDVLRDATKYPDTVEWTLPDGSKTTVGDLRTELRNTFVPKDDFTRGQQRAAEERRQLEQQYQGALQTLQQQQAALERQLAQKTGNPNAGDDIEQYLHDPVWAPVARRLKQTLERSERMEAELAATQKRLNDHEQTWWLQQHATVLKRIQDSDSDMRDQSKVSEFLAFAKNQGLPNLDTAYALYTRDRDVARAKETAAKEAYERAKTELSSPKIPTGASQTGSVIAPLPNTPASLDEAEALAKSDPEIARLMESLSA